MPRWLPIALVLLVLLGVAAYGLLRPGMEPGREPADVQQRLDGVPRKIGLWVCGDDVPLTDRTVNTGRFQAYLNRSYTNAETGSAIAVMVLYGEPGDIGAHDPKVCYAGSGWDLSEQPRKATVAEPGGKSAELWSARFRKQDQGLQVYWGWGANGDWRADDNPRFTFARHHRIFKLYAQRVLTTGPSSPPVRGSPPAEPPVDPLAEFVPRFLRSLDDALPTPTH